MLNNEYTKIVAIIGVIGLAIAVQLSTNELPPELVTLVSTIIVSILGISYTTKDKE